jgi:hypothetical protein
VRLLADRHHADLAESLLILFEDRLGIEVYFPVGREWYDAGIWTLSKGTPNDEGVRRQFLDLTEAHTEAADHYTERWPAHPERVQKLVTLEQFRSRPFDFVLASVSNHEQTFAALARQVGARFLYHVGNVFQEVDWSADPLVVATARIPIQGRGVVVHQEFSLETFRHEPPLEPTIGPLARTAPLVASFVNCFPATGCYPWWKEAQTQLPFEYREFGISGADGILSPASRVADAMRMADFIWHDKPWGDGFGHVVHNAFAVGRPVIGHAGHYAGQLADPLWIPGVTYIELAQQDPWGEIERVAMDHELHRRMSSAAATRFREVVDFSHDAELVRKLLLE